MKTKEMRLGWLTLAAMLIARSATSSGFAEMNLPSSDCGGISDDFGIFIQETGIRLRAYADFAQEGQDATE